ncbi:Acetyl-Coenzyme A Transporter 1 [Manis pentadactyla]|nr:Acetyl-Coenzyme A Transporter 1 [Manis pentadactyla]
MLNQVTVAFKDMENKDVLQSSAQSCWPKDSSDGTALKNQEENGVLIVWFCYENFSKAMDTSSLTVQTESPNKTLRNEGESTLCRFIGHGWLFVISTKRWNQNKKKEKKEQTATMNYKCLKDLDH